MYKCVHIEKLFKTETPNRRLNKYEQEHERDVSRAFCRPPCTYVKDRPFYPWLPLEPLVNFALNYKE